MAIKQLEMTEIERLVFEMGGTIITSSTGKVGNFLYDEDEHYMWIDLEDEDK